jgi:hypothetical protein
MSLELPVLLPPDELELARDEGGPPLTIGDCKVVGHNVAPDGKANPVEFDDPYFVFVYQYGDLFFVVRGLNPEMMNGHQISASEAHELLTALPYRAA